MRRFWNFCVAVAVLVALFALGTGVPTETAFAEPRYVYVGGNPIGIAIGTDGLIVTGVGAVETENGAVFPVGESVSKGDVIKAVDGVKVSNMYDFRKRIAAVGDTVTLTIERNGETFDLKVTPALERTSGTKRLGLMLKEDIGGVGTLTFVTESGAYAALGHHIYDPETGLCDSLQKGKIFDVEIENVVKGQKGKAGGLQASINRLDTPVGENVSNTEIGIYGIYNSEEKGEKIRVAGRGEARMGHAQVLTTLNGTEPELYDIDIVKVVPQKDGESKGLVLSVRDEKLLEKAGGIVQGMSGSPIIQNGVLIGAVTHVFVSDPTRGYGVHAEFMLNKAEAVAAEYGQKQKAAYGDFFGGDIYGQKEAA